MTDSRAPLNARTSHTAVEKQWTALKAQTARAIAQPVAFERERYSLPARERLAGLWRMRMESEHRSASAFATLAPQLMAARAPIDVQAAVLSGAQDELRHTEYCAQVLEALGENPAVNALVAPPEQPRHSGSSPVTVALRNLVFGSCVSEVVNAARFGDAFEVITDPYLRDITRLILADEIAHGQLGFHYLASMKSWLDGHPEERTRLANYLSIAFRQYEQDTISAHSRMVTPTNEEHELGLTDPARDLFIFTQTIEHAVVPGLMAFGIDAERAWAERNGL